jgi:trimeric autotransporter adhesin
MTINRKKVSTRLNLLAVIVAASCSSQAWAAAGDICVDDGSLNCALPVTDITTNDQSIDTGNGSITTHSVTADSTIQGGTLTDGAGTTITGGHIDADSGTFTGTVQGGTLTDGAGTTITGGDVDANSGTIDTLDGTSSTFTTFSDNAGTTINGGDVDADSGTIDTLDGDSATFNTFDDHTVTLSGGVLSDATNSISMDGTDATVDLHNGSNTLLFDATGASMTASDGTTTGSVAVTETQASVTVDNDTATHGLWVGTTDTVLSGGTTSTTLTLDNAGAHLDNELDMGNNRIINLSDGINPMDAVNRRQLDKVQDDLQSGIAAAAAIAAIPAPTPGHRFSVGIGGGFYEGNSAVAAGFNANLSDNLRLTGSVGNSSGNTVSSVGLGFSW